RDDDRHFTGSVGLRRPLGRGGGCRGRLGLGAAALDELLDLLGFFVGQTGQRRPFAPVAGFRADVDPLFSVKPQFFRECVKATRQDNSPFPSSPPAAIFASGRSARAPRGFELLTNHGTRLLNQTCESLRKRIDTVAPPQLASGLTDSCRSLFPFRCCVTGV